MTMPGGGFIIYLNMTQAKRVPQQIAETRILPWRFAQILIHK